MIIMVTCSDTVFDMSIMMVDSKAIYNNVFNYRYVW